jgi:hypothetical protein
MAMSYHSLGQQNVYNASWTTGGVTVFISSWGCAILNAWRRGCRGRKEGLESLIERQRRTPHSARDYALCALLRS